LTADHVVYLYHAIYREVKDLPGERIAFGTEPRRRLKSSADTKKCVINALEEPVYNRFWVPAGRFNALFLLWFHCFLEPSTALVHDLLVRCGVPGCPGIAHPVQATVVLHPEIVRPKDAATDLYLAVADRAE
jgi:hypothetical protein